jgi:hypothetical protein
MSVSPPPWTAEAPCLGAKTFETTPAGYRALLAWLKRYGTVELVGVKGTGSYGAGLTRHLHQRGVRVVEVDRPNRSGAGGGGSPTPRKPSPRPGPPRGGDATGEAKDQERKR